jgi:cbb3-type cytochrome oxidase subunit 3
MSRMIAVRALALAIGLLSFAICYAISGGQWWTFIALLAGLYWYHRYREAQRNARAQAIRALEQQAQEAAAERRRTEAAYYAAIAEVARAQAHLARAPLYSLN